MNRKALFILALAFISACNQDSRLPPPGPAPIPPAAPPPAPAPPAPTPPAPVTPVRIVVGETVSARFVGQSLTYELTAPRDGTLVANLTWDPWWNESLLVLHLEETVFKPVPSQWSPVIGKLSVAAGRTYRLVVGPGGTGWWYDDPFVLVTFLE
jgi:hypothetical protein